MRRDSLDKIRVKGSAKRYKRAPGPTGAARLQRRVTSLAVAAARLERKQDADAAYAATLRALLHAFTQSLKGSHVDHDSH